MVTDDFFPDVMGGAGRVVNEISKRLAKRGHSVYVLSRRIKHGSKVVNRFKDYKDSLDGVRVLHYNVDSENNFIFLVSSLINARGTFKKISQETSLDLINFHQPLSAFGVSLSSRLKGIPKVYTFHSSWPKEYAIKTARMGLGYGLRKWMEKRILRYCQKIIVLSQYSRGQLQDMYKIANSKIEIIPGGVDTQRFIPSEDKEILKVKLNIPMDKFFLFTLRNLVPRMGLENLIEAMSILVKKEPNIILIIGGKGFLEERLKGLVRKLGLEDYIKFVGFIEQERLPLYYQAADLFILPSRYLEGFGLVTLEALACGTPVLGTPVGGIKEILGKLDQDLLFRDTDAKSIAEKILFYLSSKDLSNLGKRCRDFVVSHYSWDSIAIEYEKVLCGY
jgi:glycosyltransferase involved in cell wall biosynthesis